MLTGVIKNVGFLDDLRTGPQQAQLTVRTALPMAELQLGESIAVNGVCLTVTGFGDGRFTADVSPETLACTSLGRLQRAMPVNLERALRLSDRLGGHLVTGHVDGLATIISKRRDGNAWRFAFQVDAAIGRLLVAKGSVALDGISLTVNHAEDEQFDVAIIPHTLDQTTLKERQVGDKVNVETDLIGKYVARLLAGKNDPRDGGVTLDLLAKHGFL